jgi:hypothetical protein|tara:strand:- start:4 stop:174 length:171 start_codon:yes stop_codon:yes gene_type:complete
MKYNKQDGINVSIQVVYPDNPDGSHREMSVPINNNNTEYQKIMKWVAEGNTIEEAD